MFDMFDLFISSHPHIVISFLCTCFYPCIPASSYPQIRMCLLLTSHPHILISLGSCTLCACWYPRILTFSYPYVHVLQVLVGVLASWHPHIFTFMYSGCSLVSSHLRILISSDSSVRTCLGNWNQIKTMVLTKKSSFYGNK